MKIQEIKLASLHWPTGASARIWFCQPQVKLPSVAPFIPTDSARSVEILQAVLNRDAELGAPVGGAPSVVLLPEMSVAHPDVATVKALIAGSRKNTLLVCGIGHMTSAQVDTIEASSDVFGPAIAGHFANCALIACGGSDTVYLQPKIVPSGEELDYHWPGIVVRYFLGGFFPFVVVICSDMLNRAKEKTTVSEILAKLDENGRQLAAVFWLQHNEKPRSIDFSQSLGQLSRFPRPTVFVDGSRMECPPRFEHYSVSGAFVKREAVATHFKHLTHQFHYFEPAIANPDNLSRAVLLRYDVDVNRVDTVLSSAIDAEDRTERSQLFSSVLPLNVVAGVLVESMDNRHLIEIASLASKRAADTDNPQRANVQALTESLVALGTARFQDFLDLAILPQPLVKSDRHAAGQKHKGGDGNCRCWKHRECIDLICHGGENSEPLAHVLLALAKIVSRGLNIDLVPDSSSGTNIRVSGTTVNLALCIVYPFEFSADETETAIRGGEFKMSEPGYIVLGASGRAKRPKLVSVDQSVAKRTAPVNAGIADTPFLKAVYNNDLNDWFANGTLADSLQARFSQS
jgi:hypothetical protein